MGYRGIWLLGVWLAVTAAATCGTIPSGHGTTVRPSAIAAARPVAKENPVIRGVPIPPPFDPALERIVTQARDDLSKRLSTPPDQIEVMEVQSVVWPDSSLGCARPGMIYLQVQVDGLLIRLRAAARIYEYHGGGGRSPFLCENSR